MIIINAAIVYFVWETLAGIQSVRQHFVKNFNEQGFPWAPPSLLFAKDREKYLKWRENHIK